ncbi:MAG: phenylacetate--CoA ligase family protein, partial [Pseudomonadota bacterium]
MTDYYDGLETRSAAQREEALFSALRATLAQAVTHAPYYRAALAEIACAEIGDRAALATLPVLRKGDLIAQQESTPPFGGIAGVGAGAMQRLFLSPGPIAEGQGRGARSSGQNG